MIGSYRNRPVRVDAIQWDGTRRSEEEITHWALARVRGSASGRHLTIHTPNRNERALPGDWIVKASNGQFSIMKAEEFAETYEPVPD